MNWELVAQIVVVILVLLFASILGWAVYDVTQKNKHERNLETLREAHAMRRESSFPRVEVNGAAERDSMVERVSSIIKQEHDL